MQKIWCFKKSGGQACGPIDQVALQRLAINGTLQPEDIVWKQGTELRVRADNVGGLSKYFNPKPPVQGKRVETAYVRPVQGPPPSAAAIQPVSLMPTHLNQTAIKNQLIMVGKAAIMAAGILLASFIWHLFR